MPTQGSNFVLVVNSAPLLVGSTVVAAGQQILPLSPNQALEVVNSAGPSGTGVAPGQTPGVCLDRCVFDLALTSIPALTDKLPAYGTFIGGFAKNGAIYITFTGTTPVSVDLTNLGASVGVTFAQGGDTSLATINCLIAQNLSSVISNIVLSPGASNPARMPALGGTTPTYTMAPGDVAPFHSFAGLAVDSTHKVITFTPSAGGTLVLAYGGS